MTGLTITQEQFKAAVKALPPVGDARDAMRAAFAAAGFTIAEPEPPEAMEKLAREIALNTAPGKEGMMQAAALSALQHAAKVVRDAPHVGDDFMDADIVPRHHILRQLGAIE